jgi:hypothetical protein
MINAVFDETHDQHEASASGYSGKTLQDRIVGSANLIQAAAAGHHDYGKRLQEIPAQGAPDRADEGVTEKSEAIFFSGGRDKMRTKNARENLNSKIG